MPVWQVSLRSGGELDGGGIIVIAVCVLFGIHDADVGCVL